MVRAEYGQSWLFKISVDEDAGSYKIETLDADFPLPWEHWDGKPGRVPTTAMDGDKPTAYATFKQWAKEGDL